VPVAEVHDDPVGPEVAHDDVEVAVAVQVGHRDAVDVDVEARRVVDGGSEGTTAEVEQHVHRVGHQVGVSIAVDVGDGEVEAHRSVVDRGRELTAAGVEQHAHAGGAGGDEVGASVAVQVCRGDGPAPQTQRVEGRRAEGAAAGVEQDAHAALGGVR